MFVTHQLKEEPMRDLQFETTSLPLAAALLVQIPSATLIEIASRPSIDGKRLIVVGHPAIQARAVQSVVEQFHLRRLTVPLYLYNRALNTLRDRLHHQGLPSQ